VAGTKDSPGYSGDNGAATSAQLNVPTGVAVDASGNLLIADQDNYRIRMVNTSGTISTIAGNGTKGFSGNNSAATSAELSTMYGLGVDASANLYIADAGNYRVRVVGRSSSLPTPTLTLASSANPSTYLQSVTFTATISSGPTGTITFYNGGTSIGTGTISSGTATLSTSALTVGSYQITASWPGNSSYGPVTSSALTQVVNKATPTLSVTSSLNPSTYDQSVTFTATSSVSLSGTVTFLNNGTSIGTSSISGTSTTFSTSSLPVGTDSITASWPGNANTNSVTSSALSQVVNKVTPTLGLTSSVNPSTYNQAVTFTATSSISLSGTVTFLDGSTQIGTSSISGTSTTFSTSTLAVGSHSITASWPGDANTNSATSSVVTQVVNSSSSPTISTIAGTGTQGCTGTGLATSATLNLPTGVKVDSSGNVYIADQTCATVRKITASTGDIAIIAGNGTNGYSGDGSAATSAELNDPTDVAIDSSGNVYIADYSNNRIRKVNTSGVISTYAGTGTWGYSGDSGQATSAELANPSGVALDSSGNLYIADFENKRIRKVSTSGVITTVAGNGTGGDTGDGAAATSAEINGAEFIAVDGAGDFWFSDQYDDVVRKVTASTGYISTVAGTKDSPGYSGDNGAATSAQLNVPTGVAVDASGNLYISDQDNYRIRMVNTSGTISTFAGTGTKGYSGDGGAPTSAELSTMYGLGVDASANLYIADTGNYRIRKVGSGSSSPALSGLTCTYSTLPAGAQTDACTVTLTADATSAFVVNLSSNNANVTVPSTVTVPQGSNSAGFTATAAAVSTAQSATLTASAGSVNEQFTIQLTATGPGLSSNTSSINFGNVTLNNPSTQTVILTSTGTSSVTINSITVSGTGFSESGITTPLVVNPQGTADLYVQFDPTATGSVNGTVTVSSTAPNSPITISLSGTGVTGGSGNYSLPNVNSGCPANCRQIPWQAGSDLWNGGTLPVYSQVTCTGLHADGVTDDSAGIQACITNAAANTAVYLPAAKYFVNGTVRLKSYTSLRGAKAEGGTPFMPTADSSATQIILGASAELTNTNFSYSADISGYNGYGNFPSPYTLSGSPQKGDTSLTIGTGTVSVGTWIKVFGNDDPTLINVVGTDGTCDWCGDNTPWYVQQQIVQVTGITSGSGGPGSVVTISRPLYYTPDTASLTANGETEPTGAKYNIITFVTTQAGFEDLRIDGSQYDITANSIILLQGCLDCWVKNVETFDTGTGSGSAHVQLNFTYANEVRDSAFHDERSGASGAGYGTYIQFVNSDTKVENNIYYHNRHWIVYQGGGSGTAVLYNYADDDMTDDCTYFASGRTSHGAHPFFNLFEGNIASHLAADDFWGTTSHDVMFRNWFRGGEPDYTWPSGNITTWGNTMGSNNQSDCIPTYLFPPVEGFDAVDLYTGQSYYAYVDNVLGNNSSFPTDDVWSAATLSGFNEYASNSNPMVYSYGGQLGSAASSASTIIRQGNYDYLTMGVAYNDGGSGYTYPASWYYTAKPSFMGSCPFPAQGSDLNPVDTLQQPAYQRAMGTTCQ
jgi:hypothetical protein